ncbi:hypothetical protein PV08_11050 [Exophiala spinifera]|uniref:Transcription factor domain-containing protein n=1 Tax=Exophiala spinifera TaxID=91928 RepID=A0A0D2AUD8_9EURO|nr:uncharacterized protein PV08_11050 [Exophiala spinifera]KIW10090.1 hypothetical protein PV08_11050 [Exophiala spinifera]
MTLDAETTIIGTRGMIRNLAGNDWRGISDPKKRKLLQNRLNQQRYRDVDPLMHAPVLVLDKANASADGSNLAGAEERQRQAKVAKAFGYHLSSKTRHTQGSQNDRDRSIPRENLPVSVSPGLAFDAFVDPAVREVLLFARNTLCPRFSSASRIGQYSGFTHPLSEIWFDRVLTVPMMRKAVIIGACIDLELLSSRRYSSMILSTVVELSRQVRILISQLPLSQQLEDGGHKQEKSRRPIGNAGVELQSVQAEQKIPDDLLFAVMHLVKAACPNILSGRLSLDPPGAGNNLFGLFTPPLFLQQLQFLHIWGRSCPYQQAQGLFDGQAEVHHSALEYLVSLKGGLKNVRTPGFADSLHLFDVLGSAKRLTRPKFELPQRSYWMVEHLQSLKKAHGQRFGGLRSILGESTLVEILQDLDILSSWASLALTSDEPQQQGANLPVVHLHGKHSPSTEDLISLRNFVEYRLLSYSPESDNVLECVVQTAALIFMHGVIFPLPSQPTRKELLTRMIENIYTHDNLFGNGIYSLDYNLFMIWVLTMGVMATSDKDVLERSFFVERLASLSNEMGFLSWQDFDNVLKVYYWVEWGCQAGGLEVWRMISGRVVR